MKHDSLSKVARGSLSETTLIGAFAREIDTSLAAKMPKRPDTPLSHSEVEQLRSLGEAITKAASTKPPKSPKSEVVFRTALSSRVEGIVLQAVIPIKQRGFLADMTLVYLVSHLEAFIKDYTYEVLLTKPAMLRTGRTLGRG